jgi:predicted DNA-binding ribbon-helix-helix protein
MSSSLVSRNVTISGKRTSIRLEPDMWDGLNDICRRERSSVHQICTSVSLQKNDQTSLTAAIRVYAIQYFRAAATEDGHLSAGHGHGLTMAIGSETQSMDRPNLVTLTKTSFA